MRELVYTNKDILLEVEKIKHQLTEHDKSISVIFKYFKQFAENSKKLKDHQDRTRIGYRKMDEK